MSEASPRGAPPAVLHLPAPRSGRGIRDSSGDSKQLTEQPPSLPGVSDVHRTWAPAAAPHTRVPCSCEARAHWLLGESKQLGGEGDEPQVQHTCLALLKHTCVQTRPRAAALGPPAPRGRVPTLQPVHTQCLAWSPGPEGPRALSLQPTPPWPVQGTQGLRPGAPILGLQRTSPENVGRWNSSWSPWGPGAALPTPAGTQPLPNQPPTPSLLWHLPTSVGRSLWGCFRSPSTDEETDTEL